MRIKSQQLIQSILSILLGGAVFSIAPSSAASQAPAQQQPDPARSRTFTGTVARENGQYTLRDESGKSWKVDDPDRVKPYEGKRVEITGRLDPDGLTIHIDSVNAA